ncbi:hypothetical protein [Microbulbifer sp.]|uniref:hypothetical protein n=1 Tax=Microbulbifer sp. TaxID=1908541 RepID=UPI003F37CD77
MKNNNKNWGLLLGIALITALTACGGGGGGSADVSTDEQPADTTPDVFSFAAQVDAALNTRVVSDSITVIGINTAAPISISNGEYAIDGGDFSAEAGTVNEGQTVQVRVTSANALSASTVAVLSIGGVNGEFLVTTRADNTAPEATIQFPLPSSLTTSDTILVRGTAKDAHGSDITSVRVNGVEAVSEDGFATWKAAVPLEFGQNTLNIETRDTLNTDTTAASAEIISRTDPELVFPSTSALDSANNRALVADPELGSLVSVELDTGLRTIVSGADPENEGSQIGAGTAFSSPNAVALDALNNRVLVADTGTDSLFSVDLTTGNREVLSGTDADNGSVLIGAGPTLEFPSAAALDVDNNRLLLMDERLDAVIGVDLATGDRVILSGEGNGSGVEFGFPTSLTFDSVNNRVLVTDPHFDAALFSVDLESGQRSVLSGEDSSQGGALVGAGPGFGSPQAVAVDIANNRAFVADSAGTAGRIFAVDLETGNREIFSGGINIKDEMVGLGTLVNSPSFLEIDRINNRLLMVDRRHGLVFVDLIGASRKLVNERIGTGPDISSSVGSIDVDPLHNRLLTTDQALDVIFAVNVSTGERSIFSGGDKGTGPAFSSLRFSALDSGNSRLLATDFDNRAVYTVDLTTGDRAILSDNTRGAGPGFANPRALTVDAGNNRILVTDFQVKGIFAVDPDTGDRTIISGNDLDNGGALIGSGPEIQRPEGIALDAGNNRALLVDGGNDALIAIDLETGDRAVLSGADPDNAGALVGAGPGFGDIESVVVDSVNHRALIPDFSNSMVIAVDLASGDRSVILGLSPESGSLLGEGPAVDSPTLASLDPEKDLLFVLNAGDAVMAIDLQSGERVVFSDGPQLNAGSFIE